MNFCLDTLDFMLTPETFLGKVLLFMSALAMGLLVGSITTFVHQNTVTIFGVEIPWGLILGLVAITGFLIGLRLLAPSRLVVLIAGLGIIGMIFLLTQESPGGSIVVPNNVWGVVWAVAPTIVALIIVAWPKLPQRSRGRESVHAG